MNPLEYERHTSKSSWSNRVYELRLVYEIPRIERFYTQVPELYDNYMKQWTVLDETSQDNRTSQLKMTCVVPRKIHQSHKELRSSRIVRTTTMTLRGSSTRKNEFLQESRTVHRSNNMIRMIHQWLWDSRSYEVVVQFLPWLRRRRS